MVLVMVRMYVKLGKVSMFSRGEPKPSSQAAVLCIGRRRNALSQQANTLPVGSEGRVPRCPKQGLQLKRLH